MKTLKQIIREANPEIMELKLVEKEYNQKAIKKDGKWILPKTKVEEKLVARPIRLADVLLAIEKNRKGMKIIFTITALGVLFTNPLLKDKYYLIWNLKDDNLDHQSKETIKFLEKILL